MTREEYESALAARHGEENSRRLALSAVAVAGLGGLGSNIAMLLARVGVGRLYLVDFDRVDITNLHRQQYDTDDIGALKTDALRRHIEKVNPYITVETDNVKVSSENAARLFRGFDIVCEAFDSAESKAMLVNTLLTESGDTKIIAASGMAGTGSANTVITRKINSRLYVCGDSKSDALECGGLYAPRVAVCAAHQAHTAVRLIIGEA